MHNYHTFNTTKTVTNNISLPRPSFCAAVTEIKIQLTCCLLKYYVMYF